jgi:hypothetical protein
MFPSMTISPHEKLFGLFLYTIFISRCSSCNSSSSCNNAVIFEPAVSIIIVIILQVIDYDRNIFVRLLLSCADSVIDSCIC